MNGYREENKILWCARNAKVLIGTHLGKIKIWKNMLRNCDMMSTLYERTLSLYIRSNQSLAQTIHSKRPGVGSTVQAYSFIAGMLKINHPGISESQIEESITDGFNDAGIDAVYAHDDKLEIYSCGEHDLRYNDSELLAERITKFILDRRSTSGLNPYAIMGIRKAINGLNRRRELKLFLCYERIGQRERRPLRILAANPRIKIEYLSYPDIIKRWINTEDKNIGEWKLKTPKDKFVIKKSNSSSTIVFLEALIGADKIAEIYEKYKNTNLDIFDKNVRGLMQQKYVSEGITETIREKPKLLHVFHNGLVVSCEKIEWSPSFYSIKNPQIINGLQTTVALHKIYKSSEKNLLKKAKVLCKFYATGDQRLIEQICQASNTQIRIDPNDLRSNDSIQILLEKFFELNKLSYLRKRDHGQRGLDKEEFAQWIYSCIKGNPADAKNKKRFYLVWLETAFIEIFSMKTSNQMIFYQFLR